MELFKIYFKRYYKGFIIPVISMFICLMLDLASPYIQKIILDDVFTDHQYSILPKLLILLFIVYIIKSIFAYYKEYKFDIVSSDMTLSIRNDLFKKIQSFEFSYFDNMNTGELMSRISEDTDIVWQTVSFGLRLFIENLLYFILCSVLIVSLSWKLALACLSALLPIGILTIILQKKLSPTYESLSDQTAEINSTAQQNISGVRLVKSFAREHHEILKFLDTNKGYFNLNMKIARTNSTFLPIIDFLSNISLIIMVIYGGILAINGEISLGTLLAFSSYILTLVGCMKMLGFLTSLLAQNKASSKKIYDILKRKSNVTFDKNAYAPKKVKGNISFRNVSMKYNGDLVLRNINLDIPSGSTVAIMGSTGSGKSSLLSLIGRYYDTVSGEVLVDNVNVKDWNLDCLRSNMSVVFQDTFLFSDSIANNIRFSNGNMSYKDIEKVSKESCAYDFIQGLPDKFDTLIGERGLGLSGGQKQRLAIARALGRNANILILDDSTSALDMETEFTLLNNLKINKTPNTTTFIVGHRISAVKDADIIIFMNNGQIVEKGTHYELIQKKGYYYDIYKDQFKDFNELESEVI